MGSGEQLVWIALWMGGGYALRALGVRPGLFTRLNRFIIWFPLPATILYALHRLKWESADWLPISMGWIVFTVGLVLFFALGKLRHWPRQSIGALALTAGIGNTAFIGYPMVRAIYGEQALSIAVLNDQPGTFLILATLGICAASFFSSKTASARAIVARVLKFPPIWATAAAFALHRVPFAEPLDSFLALMMKLLIPLALISVGSQLVFGRRHFQRELSPLAFGALYKLVLAPLLIALIFVVGMGRSGEMVRVSLLEAAMGPTITGAIIAREYELDPPLCSLMVTVGIPLCLVTVPLLARVLALLGI